MSTFEKIVWGIAILFFIPVLLNPASWAFAIVVVVLWLAVTYGAREFLDFEKYRRQGERAHINNVRLDDRREDKP